MTPETFRSSKLEKFIEKKVQFMIMQQQVIDRMRQSGAADEIIAPLDYNQTALYNYTFDLCQEFKIEMPPVPGVTPRTTSY